MGAVTYPDPDVQQYLEANFIPVQFNVVQQPEVMAQFNATWTPTLMVQDAEGREHRRSQGYLDPKRFLGEMALARLMAPIDRGQFAGANERAAETLRLTHDDPAREPEALYWSAVAAYKASGDSQQLVGGWNRLMDQFPQSEWAHRAEFIRPTA